MMNKEIESIVQEIDARFRSGNSIAVERAHITAAQWDQLKAALPAAGGEWVIGSPAVPGIYRVRGWHVGEPDGTAVVEVVDLDGVLWCNLHCENSERDVEGEWDTVADFNQRFEWQLLSTLPPPPARGA